MQSVHGPEYLLRRGWTKTTLWEGSYWIDHEPGHETGMATREDRAVEIQHVRDARAIDSERADREQPKAAVERLRAAPRGICAWCGYVFPERELIPAMILYHTDKCEKHPLRGMVSQITAATDAESAARKRAEAAEERCAKLENAKIADITNVLSADANDETRKRQEQRESEQRTRIGGLLAACAQATVALQCIRILAAERGYQKIVYHATETLSALSAPDRDGVGRAMGEVVEAARNLMKHDADAAWKAVEMALAALDAAEAREEGK